MAGPRFQATVEDCQTDEDEVVLRRSPVSSEKANVAAKRSNPDVGHDKSPPSGNGVHSDLHSDSGYSSHTAATMSSADTGPSAKGQSPPLAPPSVVSAVSGASGASAASGASSTGAASGRGHAIYDYPPAPPSPSVRRRGTVSRNADEDHRQSSHSSPRRPLARRESVSTRSRRLTATSAVPDCTDPNCKGCNRGRRPRPSPLDSGLDISGPPFDDQRSQHSDPAPATSYTSPPTPSSYSRQPSYYTNGNVLVQPNQTSRVRRSSSVARPMSFSGEAPYPYWPNGAVPHYPSPPQEPHGPPPAISAYHNMPYPPPASGYGMPVGTPPTNYFPPPMMPMAPQYDPQRPGMPSHNSSNFSARTGARPTSMYTQPLLTQDPAEMPSARFHSKTPSSATQPNFPRSQWDSESSSGSEDSYEEDNTRDNSRALMPPPKLKGPTQRRPSLRQAATSSSGRRQSLMSQSMTYDDLQPHRERDRESKSSRMAPPRSASQPRRPALVQHPKAQSAYETRAGKILVESSKASRRRSYQAPEKEYRVEAQRRPKIYADDRIEHRRIRRQQADTDSEDDYTTGNNVRAKTSDAEAYMQQNRGTNAPLNDIVHRAAKRGSRLVSGPSEAGSSRSKGSDKASRISHATNADGEIRLRVDPSQRLNLQLNGDMEGRTLQINHTEDGMADIIIGGGQRGEGSTYRSERGSILGSSKKSVVNRSDRSEKTRREPEEASMRSSRSSQSRREREVREVRERRELRERQRGIDWDDEPEARPLRRKNELRYHR